MSKEEQPLIIIGNESNMVHEIEPARDSAAPAATPTAQEETGEQAWPDQPVSVPQPGNDLANNDGSIAGTLDTAFHQKQGVTEGINPSGSNRADEYESRAYGQSDAAEEAKEITDK